MTAIPTRLRARKPIDMNRSPECLHTRFEAQTVATPDAPALTFAGESLSYGELNARANRLARYLGTIGVTRGTRVGLCLDRNLDPVTAILAVLKAGAAYVPMDPIYPADRVRMIVDDAACPVVLAHLGQQARFDGGDARVVVLDDAERPWEAEPDDNLDLDCDPSDLAYVIYTSGSTGRPKGALVTHHNVYRLFTAMQPDFGFGPDDVWTLFHSYAFDFSVSEMWGALFFGGRIVMVPHLVSRSPEAFHQLLIDEGVTVLNQTPSAFKQLQDVDEALPLEKSRQLKLRYVLVGGEYMALWSLAPWFERHGDEPCRIVHVYGITETTVFVTYRFLTKADSAHGTPSFIGQAISDLFVHVLDENRQPVAIGEVGELYVGGPGVCLGYLNRPELTAERFVPDPLDTTGNPSIMYKSGDLVRRYENDLEFIGRNDSQVQLRGFRIELGEVEARLNEVPGVRSGIVRLREDTPGDQRLVAWYLSKSPLPLEVLREHLLRTLPPYMVPSGFVHLESFPLNNNGKIDNSALPAPVYTSADYVEPGEGLESALAEIWQSVLRAERVGARDNFFALGGHSLLATRILLRIEEQLGARLTLRTFYESPTLSELATAVAVATPPTRSVAPITPPTVDRTRPLPLSYAQEQLWFLDRVASGNTAYLIPILVRIEGVENLSAVLEALREIVGRHEALRTRFVEKDGVPFQSILPDTTGALAITPIEPDAAYSSPEEGLRVHLEAGARAPMDLSHDPLLRFFYVPVEAGTIHAGLIIHHAFFDGWSISVLLRELARLCDLSTGAKVAPLAELPFQYADYCAWQRDVERQRAISDQLGYWKKLLAAPLPVLDFPTDHARPVRQTWSGALVRRTVAPEETRRLEALARTRDTTLYCVMMAAWNVLLHRYTDQEDLIVGTALAGRDFPGASTLIGYFVNTVVLRTQPRGDLAFIDYLATVHDAILDAHENQDVAFSQIVAEAPDVRDPGRSPLFQAFMVLHNTPVYEATGETCRIRGEVLHNGTAKFDLDLSVQPWKEGLWLDFEYNTDLFEPGTAERLLENYQTLLRSILDAPESTLAGLALVSPAELDTILGEWTATGVPLDPGRSIVSEFDARYRTCPDAIAVVDESTSLTYRELDGLANRLAHCLLDAGIRLGEPVPYYLPRTNLAIIAVLGILKAGAAYVPLDLNDPPGRRTRILESLRPRLVLTDMALSPQFAGEPWATIQLDAPGVLEGWSEAPPAVTIDGSSRAYIIFTSGSTGIPKGVACLHGGVINQVDDIQGRCPVGPGDICALWTAFSFDVSVYETWTCLLAGACLQVVPEPVRLDPAVCLGWLHQRGVTAGFLPGYMLPALLERQQRDPLPLRRLLVGVEPLQESLLCDIVAATPGLTLFNSYGPTEATEHVTLYPVLDRTPRPEGNAPIGKAIQNTRLYVLDANRNPVPIGVRGELYIGGTCLSEGYYGDETLTLRQFVPDPFTTLDSGRLYRTGDLVYYRPDGYIQFVRRIGRFIKLRGLRIDPGEIESTLRMHGAIDDGAVVLFEGDESGPRLIAYVVSKRDVSIAEEEVDLFLRERLPAYMCPAQTIFMDALPRTVQGKLDRAALPDPQSESTATADGDLPQTEDERFLATLWEEILGAHHVGRRDNFFMRGGHSLLLLKLAARIRESRQVDIPLRELMDSPTIESHARALAATASAAAPIRALPRAPEADTYPLSFAQERLWLIEQLSPGTTAYLMPLLLKFSGSLEPVHFITAFEGLIQRHEILRTEIVAGPAQRIREQVDLPLNQRTFEEADRDFEAFACRCRAALIAEAQAPIPLDTAPLFRLSLYQSPEGWTCAGLILHHAIFDGWSIRVLMDDLMALYVAARDGQPAALPPLNVRYADYAVWRRASDGSPEFLAHLAYWRSRLSPHLPVVGFPTDFVRPSQPTWEGAVVERNLAPVDAGAIQHVARTEGRSLYTVLMAAWFILLHRYSGESDLVTGTAMAGRNNPDTENLIGFFVNTAALRIGIDRNMPVHEFLGEVDRTLIEAQEHQDTPFERIVAAVAGTRDPSRSPLFQTVLVLQNTPALSVNTGEVDFQVDVVNPGTAKFEITLSITPGDGDLQLSLEYNTALYRPETAEAILANYVTLLRALAESLDAPIRDIGYLNLVERDRVLSLRGDVKAMPEAATIDAVFAAMAARHPEAVALADDTTSLTYQELDRLANQVAHLLLDRGVQREEPVPIYMSRGVWPVIAMLGILKAGAAYVPLDLLDPPGRRHRVLQVLTPRIILTEQGVAENLALEGVEIRVLDRADALSAQPATAPDLDVDGARLAYIIFTSGSTGEPKGVACPHRGVLNLVDDLQTRQPIGPGECGSVWAALSFDASVYEIWTVLLTGAALHIVPEAARIEPGTCLDWLSEHRIAAAYLPGYMMHGLRQRQESDPLPLRRLMVGVEPLRESLLSAIVAATPGLLLLNAYGPTEATVYVTVYPVPPTPLSDSDNAPIGGPIQNTRVYILDGDLQPVPMGTPGEVYIGGLGLAHGYFRDTDLTSAHFPPDPHANETGARIYRTGDLAFLRKDGNLQFVGRAGRYIKLRGYRIEPGEIESILKRVEGIVDAAVLVRDSEPGGAQLVAYIVLEAGTELDLPRIEGHMALELPPHMRPAHYVPLAALPRTVQGKLDRAALPAIHQPASAPVMDEAQSDTERKLATIWKDLLNVEPDLRDNFFDMGGHSLLAIELLGRLNDTFENSLTLMDVFEHPTISGLARRLTNGAEEGDTWRTRLFEIKSGDGIPFFSVKGAGDVGGSYETLANALDDRQAFYGFPDPVLEGEAPATVERLAEQCIADMKRVRPEGPYYIGGYSFGGIVAYEMARQLTEAGEEVPLLAMFDSAAAETARPAPGLTVENLHFNFRRIRARLTIVRRTWKLFIGYGRDGIRLAFRRLTKGPSNNPAVPGLMDYVRWIQHDSSVQYYLSQAGLVRPSMRERRLEMLEQEFIRNTARKMTSGRQALSDYVTRPANVRVTFFRAEHDPWHAERMDPTFGWGPYAKKGVKVVMVPGNHMVIIRHPYAAGLGRALQREIDLIEGRIQE